MFQIIIKLVAALLLLLGIVLIYDARLITKEFFGFGDQNEGSHGLKLLGFIVCIIGGILFYFNY